MKQRYKNYKKSSQNIWRNETRCISLLHNKYTMESAINKTITFGLTRKMVVISERIIDNGQFYSMVTVQGPKGGVKLAMRRYNNTYRII